MIITTILFSSSKCGTSHIGKNTNLALHSAQNNLKHSTSRDQITKQIIHPHGEKDGDQTFQDQAMWTRETENNNNL